MAFALSDAPSTFQFAAAVLTGLMFDHWFDVSAKHTKHVPQLYANSCAFYPDHARAIMLSVLWQGADMMAQIGIVSDITGQLVRLLLLLTASLALLIWVTVGEMGVSRWLWRCCSSI